MSILPSRPEALDHIIKCYRAALPPGEPVHEFPITALDHLGFPVWITAQWQSNGTMATGNGYGATDAEARVGGWGELFEESAGFWGLERMPRRTGSFRELSRQGIPTLDPLRARLPVTTPYGADQPIEWTEARRYPSGEPIWVPVEMAAPSFAELGGEDAGPWLFTPITNGMGAGDTLKRALAHGLLELVQRDGNSVSYRALDQGVLIELDEIADPEISELLAHYEAEGIEVQVKLAAADLGMVSLYVVGHERNPQRVPHPLMLTGCGEAAHPDREVALRKALREFASSRARKRFEHAAPASTIQELAPGYLERYREDPPRSEEQEQRALEAMREWLSLDAEGMMERIRDPIFGDRSRIRFSELPSVPPGSLKTPDAVLRATAERLRANGLEILYVSYTEPDRPVQALKAIVPGLEVETMTYHRIGPRNLRRLLDRGSPLVGLGRPPAGAYRIPMTAEAETAFGGLAWFSVAETDRTVSGLYAMYREPERHVLAFGEEKIGR